MIKNIFTAYLLIYSLHAGAAVAPVSEDKNTVVLTVTEKYVLGDGDTLTDARAINLEQAKKSASDYAGTYVESELKLTNNKITSQQVRVLTAGFTEILSSSDKRSINKSGSMVLATTAKIRLSKEAIRDGLEKLKSDPERRKKMAALEKDNQRLSDQLLDLTRKINSGKSSRSDLIAARETVLKSLEKNRKASKQIFEKGTLFQLAQLDKNEFELARKDIEQNVFGYFRHEISVETDEPSFIKNSNGTYNMQVPIRWKLDKGPAEKVLSKYFLLQDERKRSSWAFGDLLVPWKNQKLTHQVVYRKKLYNYLDSRHIVIKIDTGTGKKAYLPISGNGHRRRDSGYLFQFSTNDRGDEIKYSYPNPVVIKNLTDAQLKKISSLTASVKIMHKNSLR